ncbi:hypothetical protein [Methylopila sp. Yamaguchi]|uniref:hypothetical protein n=1 Tax=Methylopila sp. Yamaguchi TaxID=1437817 RepID=UPI000CC66385|nr:hypothetical protein [Methylopila sp. Yamaguchi]GBD48418.1 hypothetical protein METY_1631 [Methylopila sp. Yamaguchi]
MDEMLAGAATITRQGLRALARMLAFIVLDVAMEIVFYHTTRLFLAVFTLGRVTVQPLDQRTRREGPPAGRIQIGAELAMVIGLAIWSGGLICFTLWGGGSTDGVA